MPIPQPFERSAARDDTDPTHRTSAARPAQASTPRDTAICLLLAVALAPVFAVVLVLCALEGPRMFFGDYSSAAGRVALAEAILLLVAALGWLRFFVGYRRANVWARATGGLVSALAGSAAGSLGCLKLTELVDGPGRSVADRPGHADPFLMVFLALFALLPVCAGAGMRRPALRVVGLAAASSLTIATLYATGLRLLDGSGAQAATLLIAAPGLVGLLVLLALRPRPVEQENPTQAGRLADGD